METSETRTEILKATIYFGKTGELMPIVFEDCHWQTTGLDDVFLTLPVLDYNGDPIRDPLSDAGFDDQTGEDLRPVLTLGDMDVERWNRIPTSARVRLPQDWRGVRIEGVVTDNVGVLPYASFIEAEIEQVGLDMMVNDESYGALLGFPEVMAAIGERIGRRAFEYETEANKSRHQPATIYPTNQVTVHFVFDAHYEYGRDWETGIIDEANLILELKGVADLAKVRGIECPELAEPIPEESGVASLPE